MNGSIIRESLYEPMTTEWKPGDIVQHSGVYSVRHSVAHTYAGSQHSVKHQVICQAGKEFPTCNQCGQSPRFVLADYGEPIEQNEFFK
jgi:hypothetical protein